MNILENDAIHKRGRALEEAFFAERDWQLLQTLRRRLSVEEAQKVLTAATGVVDEIAIPELSGIAAPQFLAILGIFPMVEIAWCDKEVSPDERRAILAAAHEMGVERESTCHKLLERWLESRPAEEVSSLWSNYVRAVCAALEPGTVLTLKEGILGRAKKVAAAAGGFLGLGYKISDTERACMDRLAEAFVVPTKHSMTLHKRARANSFSASDHEPHRCAQDLAPGCLPSAYKE
jgi:hypothetical protein